MRILWFSNTAALGEEYLGSGSSGGGWLTSLDRAIQEKIELHVAFYHPKAKEHFRYKNAHYYPIGKGNFYINTIRKLFYQKETDREDKSVYLNLINEIQPDLIHIHGTENPFGCIINETDTPVVVSLQGNITLIRHKYLSGIELKYLKTLNKHISWRSWINGLFPFYREYRSLKKKREIEKRNMLNIKFIIGRTDWDRRISSIMAPHGKYFYGGEILRDLFYENSWRPHAREKLIIHTTNGNRSYKGFETLCHAVSLLCKKGIDFEWQVAGIKESDLIVQIVKRKLKHHYPLKNLRLLGVQSEIQLVDSLLDADIYVMTSHIENSPNNLCEAMLLGMPCIATFVGGTGSLIKDGEHGILIQGGDPWAMAGAVLELVQKPEEAIMLGKNAKNQALKRHNKEKITKDLLHTYQTILNT